MIESTTTMGAMSINGSQVSATCSIESRYLTKALQVRSPTITGNEVGHSLFEASLALTKPSEFTVFPKLPIEIRLKIWKMAELGPRLLVFGCEFFDTQPLGRLQVDPLLAVCHESRHEVQYR